MSGPRQPSAGKKKSTDNLTWQTLNSLPLNQVSCSGKKSCLVNLPDKMIITWDGSLIPHPNGMTMTSLCFSLSPPPFPPVTCVRDTVTPPPWHNHFTPVTHVCRMSRVFRCLYTPRSVHVSSHDHEWQTCTCLRVHHHVNEFTSFYIFNKITFKYKHDHFYNENKKSIFNEKRVPPSAEKKEKSNNCYFGRRLTRADSDIKIRRIYLCRGKLQSYPWGG